MQNFKLNLMTEQTVYKDHRFFKQMSEFIGTKTPRQCKAKFQKNEQQIFVELFGVSVKNYQNFTEKRK